MVWSTYYIYYLCVAECTATHVTWNAQRISQQLSKTSANISEEEKGNVEGDEGAGRRERRDWHRRVGASRGKENLLLLIAIALQLQLNQYL